MTGWTLLIATHAFAAATALPLGAWQLFRPIKGDRQHRVAGWVWVVAMLYVAVTSFWIRDLRAGQLSFLHVLSVVTIVTVTLGIVAARSGNIDLHRGNMRGSWLGLCAAFVGAVAVPDRLLPRFVLADPWQAAAALIAVAATTVLAVAAGSMRWPRPRTDREVRRCAPSGARRRACR